MTTKSNLAILVQVEQTHGTYQVIARVVIVQANGELHNPSWHGNGVNFDSESGDDGQRFDGLQISAYAGDFPSPDSPSQLWGFRAEYAPHWVQNSVHAKAIASVLGQIERGMDRLETVDGYIRDGEFSRYVMRAARTLRISKVYVRNAPSVVIKTGECYRTADANGLAYWTQTVNQTIDAGQSGSLVR